MAKTLHMQIRDAAADQVAAALGQFADGGVTRGRRTRAMSEQQHRRVYALLNTSRVSRGQYGGQPDDWTTRLIFECCARDVDGVSGEEVADDLADRVYAALAADPSIGGRCSDLVPVGLGWDSDEAADQVAVVQVAFDARHRTPSTSISQT